MNTLESKDFKNVIPINPWIVKICGNNPASGMLLTQLIYWTEKDNKNLKRNGGWTYQSFPELSKQTGMTDQTIRTTQKNLLKLGLVECKTGIAEGHNTTWWKPKRETIFVAVMAYLYLSYLEEWRTSVDSNGWNSEHLLELTDIICGFQQVHLLELTDYTKPLLSLYLNPINTKPSAFSKDLDLENIEIEEKDIRFSPVEDYPSGDYQNITGTSPVGYDYGNVPTSSAPSDTVSNDVLTPMPIVVSGKQYEFILKYSSPEGYVDFFLDSYSCPSCENKGMKKKGETIYCVHCGGYLTTEQMVLNTECLDN